MFTFEDDIGKLVSQTFAEAKNFVRQNSDFVFEEDDSKSHAQNLDTYQDKDSLTELPDEAPGILYHLQKNASTFVVRMLPSENMLSDWEKAIERPEDYPSMRLISDDGKTPEDKLSFFECDSFRLAKALKDQLANKRFPLHEERIINVSDPGDNWWIKKDPNGFSVFFKLCRTEAMDSLVKAGPLGDCEGALDFFKKLYGYFSLLFPLKDYSSAHGQLFMSCEEANNPVFNDVMNVFLEGEMGNALWEKLRELERNISEPQILDSLKRANYFMMEIATLRSFWKDIQKELS